MASLGDKLFAALLWPLPQHALSRLVHAFARLRAGGFTHWLIRRFAAAFKVNLAEAAAPQPTAYDSFNAFFTRALAADARPIAGDAATLVCPADSHISQIGDIRAGRLIQAKGMDFSLETLLGDTLLAERYQGGRFTTLYLSPRDYHRVHMPLAGRLELMTHVPGRLFSVNGKTTRAVPGLFARNERVVCHFSTEQGPLALILVGAIFVGSIETVWAGEVTPPRGRQLQSWDYRHQSPIELARGAEMGRFNMGSTVIVLTGPEWQWLPQWQADMPTRVGEALAQLGN